MMRSPSRCRTKRWSWCGRRPTLACREPKCRTLPTDDYVGGHHRFLRADSIMEQVPAGVDELGRPVALRRTDRHGEGLTCSLVRLDDVREMQTGPRCIVDGSQRIVELNAGNSCIDGLRV